MKFRLLVTAHASDWVNMAPLAKRNMQKPSIFLFRLGEHGTISEEEYGRFLRRILVRTIKKLSRKGTCKNRIKLYS